MAEIAIAGVTPVLRQVVITLGKLVVQKRSGLYKLTENLEWIENEMRYIQAYLEDDDADDEQGGSSVEGETSLKEIAVVAYDVEDVVETYFPQIASQKGKIAKTVDHFTGKIEVIRKRLEEINRVIRRTRRIKLTKRKQIDTWDPRRSVPHIDEVGLNEHREKLVAEVLDRDPKHRVVSIIGVARMGNTTLAKMIYNSVARSFDCSAWIYISQQPNIPKILLSLARQVGLEKEKREHNIEDNLSKFLHDTRYVIVIDDLYQTYHWDHGLKNVIPHQSDKGSRIILTSQNRDVGIHVGGRRSICELQPPDPEKTKKLFVKMILKNMKEAGDYLPPQLEIIGEQIMKSCGDVPLTIELTANMLLQRERTEHAWKKVLKSLDGQDEDKRSKIFALSYKDLPTKLKPCILYFGLFPKDYEILAFDLINLWVGEGFISQGGGVQEVEEVGEDYLNHLVSKKLIQVHRWRFDGRIRSCGIQNTLHSLCARVAKEIDFFNAHNDVTSDSATRVRRITTYDHSLREYIPLNYMTPKLRAVLCFNKEDESELTEEQVKSERTEEQVQSELTEEQVKSFLKESRLLRVLSLKFESLQISLPSEIGNLSHLSYLQLKVAHGRTRLPLAIDNLRSLLTLDVRKCPDGVTIPDCIWKMKQLRHFLLSAKCEIESVSEGPLPSNVDKFLNPIKEAASSVNLQTLYGLNLKVCLSLVKCWFPKFTNLTKLGLSFEDGDLSKVKVLLEAATPVSHKLQILRLEGLSSEKRYDIMDLNLSQYEKLSRLHLEGAMVKFPEPDHLPRNLIKLTLKMTQLEEDPMETLKKLPQLNILKLGTGSYKGEKIRMVCSGGGGSDNFPQLQVLEIDELDHLQELVVEEEVMPGLNKLRITGCRGLGITDVPDRIQSIMIIQN